MYELRRRADLADTTAYTLRCRRAPHAISAQIGAQWLVSCASYTVSGKTLTTWGPALTAANTTCSAAAEQVAVTEFAYDDLDRLQHVG